MSISNGEAAKLHAIRRLVVSDAGQQSIDRAILLHEATRGVMAESTPESRGHALAEIVIAWMHSVMAIVKG